MDENGRGLLRVTHSGLILIGIGLAALFWVLESAIHVVIFREETFCHQVFSPAPHEVWMRFMVVGMFIGFGIYGQFIVNARRKAEEAVTRAYSELHQIFETSADGMRVVDRDFNVQRANETFSRLSGMTREEALEKKCYEVFAGPLCHTAGCPLTRILEGEERVELDTMKKRTDGTIVPCIVTATPFREPGGRLLGIVEDFKDITERKRAEEALRRQAEELRRSNADLENFAYVASHDLKEPLRAVSGYLQLLERRHKAQLEPKARDFVDRAVKAAGRMDSLINDLLSYSRLSRQSKPPAPTDCNEVLVQVLENLETSIRDNGSTVRSSHLPTVVADRPQLVQLFQNLIANAIKFHGDAPPEVSVNAEQRDNEWVFSVRDNGIGMEMEYADRIFDVFQRLHSTSAYPGTGIGLAVCRKVVERHGGRIWVESEPGKGSVFHFTIPNSLSDLCRHLGPSEGEVTCMPKT